MSRAEAPTFTTADLYLVAALASQGYSPQRFIPDGPRTLFVFDDSGELRDLVSRYYGGFLQVDALAFAEAVRRSKAAAINIAGRGGRQGDR